jgi:endo-1,4-beta-xylanase
MAVMLYRTSKYIKLNITVSEDYTAFSDDSVISDYAKNAIYALREAGIINGVSDSKFAPLECATRAQAAKMIYGLLEL